MFQHHSGAIEGPRPTHDASPTVAFQHHSGAIEGSGVCDGQCRLVRGFNTTLVLLRAFSCERDVDRAREFQHHSGAIEGSSREHVIGFNSMFQHHSGAIEGRIFYASSLATSFVSTPLWCY